jgi:hypothetical protein
MALSLSRESRFFIAPYQNTLYQANDIVEINVLDGFSFSQATESQEVTVSEAGSNPIRGQKVFNTALNPGEFSFTTYIKMNNLKKDDFTITEDKNTLPIMSEVLLWEALLNTQATKDVYAPGSNGFVTGSVELSPRLYNRAVNTTEWATPASTNGYVVSHQKYNIATPVLSNKNQLAKIDIIVVFSSVAYKLSKACINTAEIDFAIDDIAKITWTGYCDTVKQVTAFGTSGTNTDSTFNISGFQLPSTTPNNLVIGGINVSGTPSQHNAEFLVNKLSQFKVVYQSDKEAPIGSFELTTSTVSPETTTQILTDDKLLNNSLVPILQFFDTVTPTTNEKLLQAINYFAACRKIPVHFYFNDAGNKIMYNVYSDNLGSEDANVLSKSKDFNTVFTLLTNDAGGAVSIADATVIPASQSGAQNMYTLAITGGSITISNNITYLTPEFLGVINQPEDHFTGTRTINGSLTAYLRTGSGQIGNLLSTMLASNKVTESCYIDISIGGNFKAENTVSVTVPVAHVSLPSVNVEDVISTEITFNGLGTQLEHDNEFSVTYWGEV